MLVQLGMVLRNAGERAPDRMGDAHPSTCRDAPPIAWIPTIGVAPPTDSVRDELRRGYPLTGLSDQMGELAESGAIAQSAHGAGERDGPILALALEDRLLIDRRGAIFVCRAQASDTQA